jgi:hypothetical protein
MLNQKLNFFNNFGYLEDVISDNFLLSLQEESLNAHINNAELVSGLTGNGVAKHFHIRDNREKLEQFILSLLPTYDKEFNYLNTVSNIIDNPLPLKLGKAWFNYQKRHEFIPVHIHDGVYSFVIWLNIPYNINEELSVGEHASCFKFLYTSILGRPMVETLPVSKEWVGKILLFPSSLQHVVYPFFTSSGTRISISGNIIFKNNAI